jgi:hypothetical protein
MSGAVSGFRWWRTESVWPRSSEHQRWRWAARLNKLASYCCRHWCWQSFRGSKRTLATRHCFKLREDQFLWWLGTLYLLCFSVVDQGLVSLSTICILLPLESWWCTLMVSSNGPRSAVSFAFTFHVCSRPFNTEYEISTSVIVSSAFDICICIFVGTAFSFFYKGNVSRRYQLHQAYALI